MYFSILMEIPSASHRACAFNSLRVLSGCLQLAAPEGMASKPCQGRVRLGNRKSFFPQRVAGHWHMDVATAPSLTEFKMFLDNALRDKM